MTGDVPLAAAGICDQGAGDHLLIAVQQCLIGCVVNVTVKHVGTGLSLVVHPVLAVVAGHGIVREDDFAAVVAQLRIIADPFKAGGVKGRILQIPIMIAPDQKQTALEPVQDSGGFFRIPPAQISQDHHFVTGSDPGIPAPDHVFVELFHTGKPAAVHLTVQGSVPEVAVGNVIPHSPGPAGKAL